MITNKLNGALIVTKQVGGPFLYYNSRNIGLIDSNYR